MFTEILVTGGAGFIGSNFVRRLVTRNPSVRILNIDHLGYAGNLENLKSVASLPNYRFVQTDIRIPEQVESAFCTFKAAFGAPVQAIVHFAAESHVDRSIEDPTCFLQTNVIGTQVMLDAGKRNGTRRFVHVSTDEVYGSLGPTGAFTEETPLMPNSPYAASKAGSDLIARAYYHTYQFPVMTTRCSNNYGPFQFPEKLIPLVIANALENRPIPVYGDGQNVRDWLYVDDHCSAIEAVLQSGVPGEVYNIGGRTEKTNLEIVRSILGILNRPESLIQFVSDRPGHDRRYAMDATKIERELGWRPLTTFDSGIRATVDWYVSNADWTEHVRSGAYREYYEKMYQGRDAWVQKIQSPEKPSD